MPAVGYAAHSLRLGQYRLKYPLIRVADGLLLSIEHFTEEVERVSFINGVIHLRHRDFPEDMAELQDISLDALLALLGTNLSEVELSLPPL